VYFDSKNGTVYEPGNPILKSFYEALKKHEPSISGSRFFEDLKEVYETLDQDLKEDIIDEPISRAV